MLPKLAYRILRTTSPWCLWKLAWNFGLKGAVASEKFRRRVKRGEYFPAYLHISIINSCNLHCQGCWVDVDAPREMIETPLLHKLINAAKKEGNVFFGILGGEPFLHPDLLDVLAAHPDCYFQVFTNGQLITEKVAARLRQIGNTTPLISIEGNEIVSDERRGGKAVYERSMRGLDNCLKAGLLTGVATSLCQTNIDDLLTEEWLQHLIRRGAHYVWYYAYRPIGPVMRPELALRPDQLLKARRFVVEMRSRMPIAMVDAYYDGDGQALCPMVAGISHHISPRGEIEPCPVIQFAKENIRDSDDIAGLFKGSAFLADFRKTTAANTRGCVVLERPDLIREIARRHQARDTTIRGGAWRELDQMQPSFSQWLPDHELPEGHWMYRWAKKIWFHDFGAYKNAGFDTAKRRREVGEQLDKSGKKPMVKGAG